MEIKSEQGQTLVEYILLLVVAVSLVLTFYNSEAFKKLFGTQGKIGEKIKTQNEFAYRHAYTRKNPDFVDVPRDNREGSIHPSYHDVDNNGTRFFGPLDAYE